MERPLEAAAWDAESYRAWVRENWPRYRASRIAADNVRMREAYAERLPLWLLARCPFCDAPVAERVDTFSLNGIGWDEAATGFGWLRGRSSVQPIAPGCPHLRIVAWFLHLEGRTPDDLFPDKTVRTGPEVPSIMRVPMRAADAIAVMTALPVGRWDEPAPSHAYTLYLISYFTESSRAWEEATKDWGIHWGRIEYGDVDYDLGDWAAKGRLRAAGVEASGFPWTGIEGDRSPERILTRAGVAHPKLDIISRLLKRLGR